ncbi:hypothetical protein FSP39_010697 [Pinctada imbricata]|uniref:Transmembrane protein 106B n=1 Tax=Pinctada imbricata TaxID=66713 RepID=A0AA89CAR6_PINIB|nr:hypothetical protein FSP39_010697 [Pinctada imbricata]
MGDTEKEKLLRSPVEPARYMGFDEESKKLDVKVVPSRNGSNTPPEPCVENSRNLRTENSIISSGYADGSRQRMARESTSRSEGYTELLRGSVPCPTCRGAGNIPKEQEHQLVALIPVKDERLKPRRTWLYVLLAVSFCVITAGLLIFFMFPRDVTLSSNVKLLLPSDLVINKEEQFVSFTVKNLFNISNSNYFPVYMSKTSMQVIFNGKVLNTTTDNQTMKVPIRGSAAFDVDIEIQFNKENGFAQMV